MGNICIPLMFNTLTNIMFIAEFNLQMQQNSD